METNDIFLLKILLIKLVEDSEKGLRDARDKDARDLAMAEVCSFYERGSAVESLHPSL